jgi:hypothetical protein
VQEARGEARESAEEEEGAGRLQYAEKASDDAARRAKKELRDLKLLIYEALSY